MILESLKNSKILFFKILNSERNGIDFEITTLFEKSYYQKILIWYG